MRKREGKRLKEDYRKRENEMEGEGGRGRERQGIEKRVRKR